MTTTMTLEIWRSLYTTIFLLTMNKKQQSGFGRKKNDEFSRSILSYPFLFFVWSTLKVTLCIRWKPMRGKVCHKVDHVADHVMVDVTVS
jgi:hypothetical protein